MGILRTLLAISVVFAHVPSPLFVGGRYAVQLFYMISGFLISYVLVEKKSYLSAQKFYTNRYLRLFPVYFFVALLTLGVCFLSLLSGKDPSFLSVYQKAPWTAQLLLIFSNVTLLFQDWIMFCGVENNQLVFTTNYLKSEVILWPGLLVPQAWTLGLELSFYLLAPFILPKRRLLLFLLIISIGVRGYLFVIGLGTQDPWNYRFFPAELALFIIGALSHQILFPFYKRALSSGHFIALSSLATFFLCVITSFFLYIPIRELLKAPLLFLSFFLLLPFSFVFQSRHSWDRWIGDLSYPIYIGHMLIFQIGHALFDGFAGTHRSLFNFGCLVTIFLFAFLLKLFVADPIESLRNQFRLNCATPIQL